MQPLFAQRRPLQHAEPMLLVDHHQPELPEGDVALDQRVRADHQMDRPVLDLGELLTPLRRRRRAGQQRDPEARGLQQAA